MENPHLQTCSIEHIPDLLNNRQQVPKNLEELQDLLQFAFSTGESAGALGQSLAHYCVSDSLWDEDCFAEDLFVQELIESCFAITANRFTDDFVPPQNFAYLMKVLCHPPKAKKSVFFRQDIQKELLAKPKLRSNFETIYRKLAELRDVLDSAGVMGCEYSTRRRIDILLQIKQTVDLVAREFSDADSGIIRIRQWAREFQAGEGYAMLRDFVDYEGRLSSVHLQLRVGIDGKVRNFKIVGLSENSENRFYKNPVMRFWGWFRLFLRGYQIGRDELVARVVESVFDAVEEWLSHFLILIGHMEFHLASIAFKELCQKNGLETCHPKFLDDEGARVVDGLFNPLLLKQEIAPVTCDFKNDRADVMMIITGPNSGGKTRLLQALGVLQILGQGGFMVPAKKAVIHFKTGLFVSLLEGSTAGQEEGRLGTELLRIRRLFEKSQRGALIILDELCSGTNPSEGEEIFLLVISLLKKLTPEAYITTHFLRFARQLAREHANLELDFSQVQLDENQEPTYKFIPGVAKTSLAGQTAKRLGVTREHLLSLIEKRTVEPFPN